MLEGKHFLAKLPKSDHAQGSDWKTETADCQEYRICRATNQCCTLNNTFNAQVSTGEDNAGVVDGLRFAINISWS